MVATCKCIFRSDFITKCPIKKYHENYGEASTLLSDRNGYRQFGKLSNLARAELS